MEGLSNLYALHEVWLYFNARGSNVFAVRNSDLRYFSPKRLTTGSLLLWKPIVAIITGVEEYIALEVSKNPFSGTKWIILQLGATHKGIMYIKGTIPSYVIGYRCYLERSKQVYWSAPTPLPIFHTLESGSVPFYSSSKHNGCMLTKKIDSVPFGAQLRMLGVIYMSQILLTLVRGFWWPYRRIRSYM